MVDHNELIAQFVSISGATAEQAQFYLEANNWDINVSGTYHALNQKHHAFCFY